MENFGTPMEPGGAGPQAREAVSLPAILLMITSGLTLLYLLFSLVQGLNPKPPNPEDMERARQALEQLGMSQFAPMLEQSANISPGQAIFYHLPFFILHGLIFLGALKMKGLRSYGLAMTASILALIPCCGPCVCLGIPLGIWSLVVLRKPEVRAAFT